MQYNEKACEADKRAHLAKISSLKNQVSGEQVFADELDAEHAKVSSRSINKNIL